MKPDNFIDTYVSREFRYSVGNIADTGGHFLSVPVANQMVDYEEYYRITPSQFEAFMSDNHKAARFADECRERQHDALLIPAPGTDRGVAI